MLPLAETLARCLAVLALRLPQAGATRDWASDAAARAIAPRAGEEEGRCLAEQLLALPGGSEQAQALSAAVAARMLDALAAGDEQFGGDWGEARAPRGALFRAADLWAALAHSVVGAASARWGAQTSDVVSAAEAILAPDLRR